MEDRRTETRRLLETRQVAAAAARLENEVRATPDDALLNVQLANVLLRLHRFDEARIYALRAIELAPESASGHVQLAYVLLHMDRFAEAEVAALQAQRLQTDSLEVDRALLAASEGQGKLVEAESWARKIAMREPNNPQAHRDLARLLLRQNRLVEAQQEFWTAFAQRREYVTGWSLLVLSLRRYHLWWPLWLALGVAIAVPSWFTAPFLVVGVILIAGGALNEFLLHRLGKGVVLLFIAVLAVVLFIYRLAGVGGAPASVLPDLSVVTPQPIRTGVMADLVNQRCRSESRPECLVVAGAKRQTSGDASTLLLVDTILVNQSNLELMVDCFVEDSAGQLYERLWDTGAGQDVLATARLVPGDVWRDTIRFALPEDKKVANLRCQVYQRTPFGSDPGIGPAVGYKHYDRGEDLLAELPSSAR